MHRQPNSLLSHQQASLLPTAATRLRANREADGCSRASNQRPQLQSSRIPAASCGSVHKHTRPHSSERLAGKIKPRLSQHTPFFDM